MSELIKEFETMIFLDFLRPPVLRNEGTEPEGIRCADEHQLLAKVLERAKESKRSRYPAGAREEPFLQSCDFVVGVRRTSNKTRHRYRPAGPLRQCSFSCFLGRDGTPQSSVNSISRSFLHHTNQRTTSRVCTIAHFRQRGTGTKCQESSSKLKAARRDRQQNSLGSPSNTRILTLPTRISKIRWRKSRYNSRSEPLNWSWPATTFMRRSPQGIAYRGN